jgi:hypothetical protein
MALSVGPDDGLSEGFVVGVSDGRVENEGIDDKVGDNV